MKLSIIDRSNADIVVDVHSTVSNEVVVEILDAGPVKNSKPDIAVRKDTQVDVELILDSAESNNV